MLRFWIMACCAWALMSLPASPARAADACPQLPSGGGLRWEQRDLPGMVFCKAIGNEGEMFSVTLGNSLPFRPVGNLQSGRGTIGGQRVRWYRGSDGFDANAVLRETVLKLGRGREAHIVVRAQSEAALEERLRLVENLGFDDGG